MGSPVLSFSRITSELINTNIQKKQTEEQMKEKEKNKI